MKKLVELQFHLKRANRLYMLYKEHPNYRHAQTLKRANNDLAALIPKVVAEQHGASLNELLLELIVHLDFWFVQFEDEVKSSTPQPQSRFQFIRETHYPSYPASLLEEIENMLKK